MKKADIITEKQLHAQICDYIKKRYPSVIFNTDLSGLRLTLGQATQAKHLRSGNGFPDIVIYKMKTELYVDKVYGALFLEVKKESPFKRNWKLKNNAHLIEQNEMHIRLRDAGYAACFVWTFEQAVKIIDNYLNN